MNRQGLILELRELYCLRGSPLTSFMTSVAHSIYETLFAALTDGREGRKRLQVSSAPTGSGKSSSAIAFLSYAYKEEGVRSAFVVETVRQAEDTYRELKGLLGKAVAVWTSVHDAAKTVDDEMVEADKGFRPTDRFHRSDLRDTPVVIVTHSFFEGRNGRMAADGRDLVVYDEKPRDVSVFDLSHGDIADFRDQVLQASEPRKTLREAADQLWSFVDRIYEGAGEIEKTGLFRPINAEGLEDSLGCISALAHDPDQMAALSGPKVPRDKLEMVAGFARALAAGYAFISKSRYQTNEGCRFVGYSMDFPLRPGMALLDATSDIDGVSQLVHWRAEPKACPQVSYSRLGLHSVEPPADLRRLESRKILAVPRLVDCWKEWITDLVARNTAHGDEVLIVVHKAMIAHLPRIVPETRGDTREPTWAGRTVHYCNWGDGIGSNRWRNCSHVFLIGEFFVPRRATVADCLGLQELRPSGSTLRNAQDVKALKGSFLGCQEGHLLRWTKQLACRGNVRNVDENGVCGPMQLFVTGEFDRLLRHRDRLFPGGHLITRDTTANPRHRQTPSVSFMERLGDLLLSTPEQVLTAGEVENAIRTRLDRHVEKLKTAEGQAILGSVGWEFVPGRRGRGNPAKFVRSEQNAPEMLLMMAA